MLKKVEEARRREDESKEREEREMDGGEWSDDLIYGDLQPETGETVQKLVKEEVCHALLCHLDP